MENEQPRNPPAFPNINTHERSGMTLRDYFAAKAISGVMSGEYFGSQPLSEYVKTAFQIADEMLKQREL